MKTIQMQVTFTLDEATENVLADLLALAIKQAVGADANETDDTKNAKLRASQRAIFAGAKPPEDQGLLINSKEAAKLLKVSPRTLWRMQTSGEMPAPIRLGRAVRWSAEVLKKWVEAGCPPIEPPSGPA